MCVLPPGTAAVRRHGAALNHPPRPGWAARVLSRTAWGHAPRAFPTCATELRDYCTLATEQTLARCRTPPPADPKARLDIALQSLVDVDLIMQTMPGAIRAAVQQSV